MKNLKNLGRVLNKTEQQSINGGNGQNGCICYYHNAQTFSDCEQQTRHLECEIAECDPTVECAPED